MDSIVFDSVRKVFRRRPGLFSGFSRDRSGQTLALDDVSFQISRASVLALLGPNGSGKTTLLKLVSTMLLPDNGRVLIEGLDTRTDSQQIRHRVGFAVATERSFFPRLTAFENLEFFAALEDSPRGVRRVWIEYLLAWVGLSESRDLLAMKLSSGMYQRLGIARALLKRPSVLLLDEPTRSLDVDSSASICDLVLELARNGTTVVLATHDFEEAASVADSVLVLRNGRASTQRATAQMHIADLRTLYDETVNGLPEPMLESA